MNLLSNKAFTLIEVMVCIVLTCIVVFFVYTMMLSSHETFSKLFNISKQRNDIRYFETLLRNSIENSENIKIKYNTKNSIIFEIFYSSTDSPSGYRLNVFEFTKNDLIVRNKEKSMTLFSEEDTKYYSSSGCDVKFYSKPCNSKGDAVSGSSAIPEHIVIRNVNALFWEMTQFDVNEGYEHHAYFTISLIFSKTLSRGEINTENRLYRFSMRNYRPYDNVITFSS